METYVDGYVLSVPKERLDEYKKMAQDAGEIWMKHGALAYYECVGDDMYPSFDSGDPNNPVPDEWKPITFPEMMRTKTDEVVIFSFVVYKSREHRDEVNAMVMKDPNMNLENCLPENMPFDMKKMAYGGFMPMVSLGKIGKG